MYHIYISSFGDKELAFGAAQSVKKFCTDTDKKIILIDMSKTILQGPFDEIIHMECGRWMGWTIAKKINKNSKINMLCIDDDVRLVDSVSLSERYNDSGVYKPSNGAMVMAFVNTNNFDKINLLKSYRAKKSTKNIFKDNILWDLCVANYSEIIDEIWVHIDKGYEKRTQNRTQLINYIDMNVMLTELHTQ